MKENGKEKNFAYIKMHKSFTRTEDSKFENIPKWNMMYLPKGIKIGEMDLSGGVINPIVMYEDKFNPNMMVAQYDKDRLEDNAITVNLRKDGKNWEKVRVDVDVLASAVHEANKEYLKSKKEVQKEEAVTENLEKKQEEEYVR